MKHLHKGYIKLQWPVFVANRPKVSTYGENEHLLRSVSKHKMSETSQSHDVDFQTDWKFALNSMSFKTELFASNEKPSKVT